MAAPRFAPRNSHGETVVLLQEGCCTAMTLAKMDALWRWRGHRRRIGRFGTSPAACFNGAITLTRQCVNTTPRAARPRRRKTTLVMRDNGKRQFDSAGGRLMRNILILIKTLYHHATSWPV
ncbi:hypothetical protein KCP71_16685 [Salmonella enterica subsp. enterica]|nr:hypothetical protein KCP71_16685 [Salmonella enterica subsp. enterica]